MNSLWDIRIFLGLVPKESHYIYIGLDNELYKMHGTYIKIKKYKLFLRYPDRSGGC